MQTMKLVTSAILLLCVAHLGCRPSASDVAPDSAVAPAPHAPVKVTPEPERPVDALAELEKIEVQPDKWLFVEGEVQEAGGAWVTGWFSDEANKIAIETHGANGFRLELSKISIDWSRRVVLRIDERSFELKKRKTSTVHFKKTPTGGWDTVP